jgi:hypothetical protein
VDAEAARRTARLQAGYFLVTGIWALTSRRTFEAVTGPKADFWLVRTVGALTAAIGGGLAVAARRGRVAPELAGVAAASSLGLAAVDVVYTSARRISPVYLGDAALEAYLVWRWARASR